MISWIKLTFSTCVFVFLLSTAVSAAEEPSREQILEKRMEYYIKYSNDVLPWYYLAAIDQFERNIQEVRNDIPKRDGVVAIQFSDDYWTGVLNPLLDDTNLTSIAFFNGRGLDGNQDGIADRENDDDVMITLTEYLMQFGVTEKDFEKALKEYYQRDETVKQIMTNAEIYKEFETLNLDARAFPLAINHNYSYRSTWGELERLGW